VSAPRGESRADIIAKAQQAVAPSNVTTILSGAPPFASMERKNLSPAEETSTTGMQTAEPMNSLLDPTTNKRIDNILGYDFGLENAMQYELNKNFRNSLR